MVLSHHCACKKEDEVHFEVDAHGKSVSKNNGSSRKRNLLHFPHQFHSFGTQLTFYTLGSVCGREGFGATAHFLTGSFRVGGAAQFLEKM